MESRMKLPLFDEYWIDFRPGTIRRYFAPEPYSLCRAGAYNSLIYDPDRRLFRVYYEELIDMGKDGPRLLKAQESADLKTFTQVKNAAGSDVLYDGEGGVHGCSVLYDKFERDPDRRYKLCGMTRMGRSSPTEVEIGFSADGIEWRCDHTIVAHPYTSDALNKLMYDPAKGEYCLFHRSAFVDRRIVMKRSKDLVHWTEPRVILQPGPNYDDGHTGMQHYSMSAAYMDGIFYGLLWRYNTSLYDMEFSRMFGYMEPELVYSYDGNEYLYTSGKPLMERPAAPQPGCVGLAPHDICESPDGQWYYILCSGYTFIHGTAESNKRLDDALKKRDVRFGNPIYRIRRDGFCGIESVGPGGQVITKPIELLRDDLTFNLRANVGYARFGLMDKSGHFLEGFSYDDCIPFEFADSVCVRPQWKHKTLSEALNRQVRVAVELNSAILHCISGAARPYLVQPQRSFADPMGLTE